MITEGKAIVDFCKRRKNPELLQLFIYLDLQLNKPRGVIVFTLVVNLRE